MKYMQGWGRVIVPGPMDIRMYIHIVYVYRERREGVVFPLLQLNELPKCVKGSYVVCEGKGGKG